MSDAAAIRETPPDKPDKPGMLADPVVRTMAFVSVGIMIIYLAGIVGVLGTGVIEHDSPRSMKEKELMLASAQLSPLSKGEAWAPYINALIATGDSTGARLALRQARASATASMPVSDLDLAEARLNRANGDNGAAAQFAKKAMAGYEAELKETVAEHKKAGEDTTLLGLRENYYNAALVRGYALEKLGRMKDAVAMLDVYVKQFPTASDILIDRGQMKAKLKDKTGAEKDFRQALKFVPYDKEAKAGLKSIGVAK